MTQVPIGGRPVRLPDRRSSADVLRIAGLIFGVAAPFIAYMWISASQLKGEYHLSRLVEEKRQLSRDHERLALIRDALLSPESVDRAAREKLGMVDEDSTELTLGVPPPPKKPETPPAASTAPPPVTPPPAPRPRGSRP